VSTIRTIYHPNPDGSRRDPGFPATDQHPQAARYPFDHPTFGLLNVDAIDGPPTQAEIDALLNPPPVPVPSVERDRARDVQKLEKALADGDQATFNALALKLLKGDQ